METRSSKRRLFTWLVVVTVVVALAATAACAPKPNPGNPTPVKVQPTTVPESDSHGVIKAESWKDIYPNEYRTYLDNNQNVPPQPEYTEITAKEPDTTTPHVDEYDTSTSTKADYLELYPEIAILGKGYGYAKLCPICPLHMLWDASVSNLRKWTFPAFEILK